MRKLRLFGLAVAVSAISGTAAACDPAAPESAERVVVLSGDSQVVSVNAILPDPIEVQVQTADGKPRRYAPLYWTIGREVGTTIVPAGRIIEAYASADRNGIATGEFQVAEAGIYKIEAVAKRYTNDQGQEVKVSAVATIIVQDAQ